MVQVSLTVNGRVRKAHVEPRTLLVHFLREHLNLTGTHVGCDTSQCGACTVLIDGQPTRACTTPVSAVGTKKVATIESLPADGSHPLQKAWIELDVPQCGYCQAGQLMSASALLTRTPRPTDAQIDTAMSANVCRCGTYLRIKAAIKQAANGGRA
jgi:isoquinoline 1-oxidoreductase alpha subunit